MNFNLIFIVLLIASCRVVVGDLNEFERECEDVKLRCLCPYPDGEYYLTEIDAETEEDETMGGEFVCVLKDGPYKSCWRKGCNYEPEHAAGEFYDVMINGFHKFIVPEPYYNFPRLHLPQTPCGVPNMRTAQSSCMRWGYKTFCNVTCGYGYGFDQGGGKTVMSRRITCDRREDYWKPEPMEECRPYLNCNVKLRTTTGAHVKCSRPFNRPTKCWFYCVGDSKSQWSSATCNDDTFEDELPYCLKLAPLEIIHPPPEYTGYEEHETEDPYYFDDLETEEPE